MLDEAVMYCRVGWTCQQFQHFGDAIWAYNQAIRLRPDYLLAIYRRATCYDRIGKPYECTEDFAAIARQFPDSQLADLSSAIFSAATDEDLLTAYTLAILKNPCFPELWYSRAEILVRTEALDEALADLKEAENIAGDWPAIFLLKSRILEQQGKYLLAVRAIAAYQERSQDCNPWVEDKIANLLSLAVKIQ